MEEDLLRNNHNIKINTKINLLKRKQGNPSLISHQIDISIIFYYLNNENYGTNNISNWLGHLSRCSN